jgi:dienelactone hydrolase
MVLGLNSCAHMEVKCCSHVETREEKAHAIRRFESLSYEHAGLRHDYLVMRVKGRRKGVVLLLHEMPSLSVNVLKFAQRLVGRGYDVYVPDLWDSQSSGGSRSVFLKNLVVLPLSKGFRLDQSEVPSRKIVDWLAHFSRDVIVNQYRGERIGCVGLCVTGVFPVVLAGLVPEIDAPVVCQPALLRLPLSPDVKADTGMSRAEVELVRARMVREENFQILALRFENDKVSPPERLETLRACFPGRVLNGTLMAREYHETDGLPPNAHAIFTDCSEAPCSGAGDSVINRAFGEMMDFLDCKLTGEKPGRYVPSAGAVVRADP